MGPIGGADMLITDKEALKKYTKYKNPWAGIPSIEITKGGRHLLLPASQRICFLPAKK